MSKLRRNGRHTGHAFILAPCHVSNELVKLLELGFHGRKIIIEEAKTPPRKHHHLGSQNTTSDLCK